MDAWIDNVKINVVSWLNDSSKNIKGYSTAAEVFEKGDKTMINSLVATYSKVSY